MRTLTAALFALTFSLVWSTSLFAADAENSFDVVVVGGTPGGIMSAIGAARLGKSAVILDRTNHIGGLPANGLGATDIGTRGGTGGLFLEFVGRVKQHYIDTYGANSEQVKVCSDGYHFEASVAEKIFEAMLAEQPKITVLKRRQFDAKPENVTLENGAIVAIKILNRDTRASETYRGKVFIDATYEGDLAAAAGAPWRTRREGKSETNEPLAGRVYKKWGSAPNDVGEGSTFEGDDTIQAYNFRLCLTTRADNMAPIEKPATYNRDEYVSLIDDVKLNRRTGSVRSEHAANDIGFLVNMVTLPNGKTDANNQHLAFLSTDLPEENWPWPNASWEWRDQFAQRQRDYTLGLIWFAQNDSELPEAFRNGCRKWGFAKDEYTDNGNFPRQVYVREGRRIEGEHLFTALDAIPTANGRPPLYADSITASHYALDSHAIHKREPNRVHLDGFISHPTKPYTVPYGVMVPKKIEQLLAPVPVSGTHIGFSTLRMEPCWMAMGQAAGVAAALAIDSGKTVRAIDTEALQNELLKQKAILIYYRDVSPAHPNFDAVQYFGLRGFVPAYDFKPNAKLDAETAAQWSKWSGVEVEAGATRGEAIQKLYDAVQKLPADARAKIKAD
jgi:hypothetical protein